MKGANAEPWVKTTSAPKSTRTSTIDPSHHFFRTRRKSQSSRGRDGWAGTRTESAVARRLVNSRGGGRRTLVERARPCFTRPHGTLDADRGGDANPAGDPSPQARPGR